MYGAWHSARQSLVQGYYSAAVKACICQPLGVPGGAGTPNTSKVCATDALHHTLWTSAAARTLQSAVCSSMSWDCDVSSPLYMR
jgi:hypothetical protein